MATARIFGGFVAASLLLWVTVAGAGPAGAAPAPAGSPAGVALAAVDTDVMSPAVAVSTAQVCGKVAAKAGFSYNNYISTNGGSLPVIVVAVAVALAESGCNPSAVGTNPGSRDRGLWQINDYYHSEVSDACAFQVQCNANAAFNISGKGYNWGPWSTYNNGLWKAQISTAKAAVYGFSFQLKNRGTGTCLDADASRIGNGQPIFQWTCNGSDAYQQWYVTGSTGQIPILKNRGTGTCLDADASHVGNGGTIFQWTCNQSDRYQQWWFYGSGQLNTNGNANAGVHNVGTGSTCLDADASRIGNGQPIFQWACNQSDIYQEWN